jgi:hypothetical protein
MSRAPQSSEEAMRAVVGPSAESAAVRFFGEFRVGVYMDSAIDRRAGDSTIDAMKAELKAAGKELLVVKMSTLEDPVNVKELTNQLRDNPNLRVLIITDSSKSFGFDLGRFSHEMCLMMTLQTAAGMMKAQDFAQLLPAGTAFRIRTA